MALDLERKNTASFGVGQWAESPEGRYLIDWEIETVGAMIADFFGYNALQLGLPECDFLLKSRIPLKKTAGRDADVGCAFSELPFASSSIDLIVMPHLLESHEDPHPILREAARVLIPEGQLFIVGLNPASLWGLKWRFFPPGRVPGQGRLISVLRLKDWLQLLGFEVDRGRFGCYAPPFCRESWLARWRFMERAGDRWWGFAGGAYVVRAVKKVRGMRLIVPTWHTGAREQLAAAGEARRSPSAGTARPLAVPLPSETAAARSAPLDSLELERVTGDRSHAERA